MTYKKSKTTFELLKAQIYFPEIRRKFPDRTNNPNLVIAISDYPGVSDNGLGETDDNITDEDDLNDSSQKPIMTSSYIHSNGGKQPPMFNGGDWRSTNYSGSSSLSSFSYSPRSNNSSVSSHGKKQTTPFSQPRILTPQNGSLKSNTSQPDKLQPPLDSH